jgi:hypothetical protein
VTATEFDERRAAIGWGRAIGTALVIVVVGFLLVVYIPNRILLDLTGLSRNGRTYITASLSVVVVLALAWGLRRLQARALI